MLFGGGVLLVVELCLVVYCVLDIIPTPDDRVRRLPKLVWLVLVLLFPLVGGTAWLLAGRPQASASRSGGRGVRPARGRSRPARAVAPDDDEAFLRDLRERAEQQRRAAEEQRRAREAGPDA